MYDMPKEFPNGNFYPVTSALMVRDTAGSNVEVVVMNDRTQAGSADNRPPNTIQMLQHRRLKDNDNKGVPEPLDEKDPSG